MVRGWARLIDSAVVDLAISMILLTLLIIAQGLGSAKSGHCR